MIMLEMQPTFIPQNSNSTIQNLAFNPPSFNPQNLSFNPQNPRFTVQNLAFNPQNPQNPSFNPQNPNFTTQNPAFDTRGTIIITESPTLNTQNSTIIVQNPNDTITKLNEDDDKPGKCYLCCWNLMWLTCGLGFLTSTIWFLLTIAINIAATFVSVFFLGLVDLHGLLNPCTSRVRKLALAMCWPFDKKIKIQKNKFICCCADDDEEDPKDKICRCKCNCEKCRSCQHKPRSTCTQFAECIGNFFWFPFGTILAITHLFVGLLSWPCRCKYNKEETCWNLHMKFAKAAICPFTAEISGVNSNLEASVDFIVDEAADTCCG